jgi:hypothetical protein
MKHPRARRRQARARIAAFGVERGGAYVGSRVNYPDRYLIRQPARTSRHPGAARKEPAPGYEIGLSCQDDAPHEVPLRRVIAQEVHARRSCLVPDPAIP